MAFGIRPAQISGIMAHRQDLAHLEKAFRKSLYAAQPGPVAAAIPRPQQDDVIDAPANSSQQRTPASSLESGRFRPTEGRFILAQAVEKSGPLNLGQGYSGRIDRYMGAGGDAKFEIHVFNKGEEVGFYNEKGQFNKHQRGIPELPKEVENRLKGISIDELRRQGKLPSKGEADLKGKTLLEILKLFGKNIIKMPIIIIPPYLHDRIPGEDVKT